MKEQEELNCKWVFFSCSCHKQDTYLATEWAQYWLVTVHKYPHCGASDVLCIKLRWLDFYVWWIRMFRMPESLVTNITFLSEPALSNAQATKHSTTLQSLCGIDKSHHWQCPGIFVTGHLAGLVERTGLVGVASTPFGVFSPNTTAHNSNTALLLNEKLHNIYIVTLFRLQ